ncbi:hypothetical protein EYR41_001028 [Orbilia oligospora]|uniref:Uncharacterized protein n=1 Tax=Orbilia oligospora TaxID=2813651 RepID=A0A7C8PEQ1_ORBOL|nr:hypothetical protein TWF751_004500 [Orbilia oligospora]TGJ73969.1 hypothetical protein EYR41_001028 [Orbilia oligospora]
MGYFTMDGWQWSSRETLRIGNAVLWANGNPTFEGFQLLQLIGKLASRLPLKFSPDIKISINQDFIAERMIATPPYLKSLKKGERKNNNN